MTPESLPTPTARLAAFARECWPHAIMLAILVSALWWLF